MRSKKGRALVLLALALALLTTGPSFQNRSWRPSSPGSTGEEPAWWQLILHLKTDGDYRLESGQKTVVGHYAFELRWRGFIERDDDDYLVYALDDELRQWEATETSFSPDAGSPSTTTDFKDRPSFLCNYIVRRDNELHLDFLVNGIVVPQAPSEESVVLLFPSSAENNQHDQQIRYNPHVTEGSNRVLLKEEEIYAGRVDRTYAWGWKNRSWRLAPDRTISIIQAHHVIVKLTLIPRYLLPR